MSEGAPVRLVAPVPVPSGEDGAVTMAQGRSRPAWAEIDLAAVAHNAAVLARLVAPAELCGVVKAHGYGHGGPAVARAALAGGAGRLAVALVDEGVELVGVEAGGDGIDTERHGAPLTVAGRAGVLHGALSAVMQDEEGQIIEAHSISAGLDYPGTGPQHAHLRDSGRARYEAIADRQALTAFREVACLEGIIPALETAHALAWTLAQSDGELDLVCLSGRGDKDLAEVLDAG